MMHKRWMPIMAILLSLGLQAQAEEPKKIAFVDTGNTGRSVMAEALANAIISHSQMHIAIISRAVDMDPYDVAPEVNGVALLKLRGIDVSAHRAAQITANDVKHSDVLLTMTDKHKAKLLELYPDAREKIFTLSEYAAGTHVDVPDAWGKPMPAYEAVAQQLDQFVPAALSKILTAKN
jgi:protein-tyrosine phosphatase